MTTITSQRWKGRHARIVMSVMSGLMLVLVFGLMLQALAGPSGTSLRVAADSAVVMASLGAHHE